MKFSELSKYLEKLENISSRNEMTEILAELFKKADKKEVANMTHLLLGELAPSYEEKVFNMAEQMMVDAVTKAFEADKAEVKEMYKEEGDLGIAAQKLAKKKSSKRSKLSVNEVFKKLLKIAELEGEGSVEKKVSSMAELLEKTDPLSVRYLTRIPLGKLRLGFSDKTIIDAISWMKNGDKSAKKKLEKAYYVQPDVGALVEQVKTKGVEKATKRTTPKVGIPVLPMLAQRLKKPEDMIKKMEEVAIEPKLDGLRTQIHFKKGDFVKTYTRNLNEISWMFPELEEMSKYVKADELIVDCEAVGLDEERQKVANFQTTMTRRRKHEIEKTAGNVPIEFYVFDILLKDGKSIMEKNYLERRKVLEKSLKEGDLFNIVEYDTTKDPKDIVKAQEDMIAEGLEGIIVKRVDGKYIPGRTGWRWVKMKEAADSVAKLADTVDCVVLGYTRGRGKRAEFGVGQFLVGVQDNGQIKSITKVGTGLTDEQFRELKKRLTKIQTDKKPKIYKVHKDLEPDYWVEPELVVEIAADEITKSPKHTAKYALRFPRLVKFRDDRNVNQATSLKEIKNMYKLQ